MVFTTKPVEEASVRVGAVDARRVLVERVIRSTAFAKSERLSTFLTCVCELTLTGRASEINEQKIGTMLFKRSSHYDSSIDGIVRTQASRLRQRLDLYFNGEGASEPVRIVLPRGSYVPVFEARATVAAPDAIADSAAMSETPYLNRAQVGGSPVMPSSRTWSPWGLSLVLAIMLMALWIHDHQSFRPAVILDHPKHPLWSHLFTKNQPTMVVAPDSGLVLFHALSGRDIDLKGYMNAGYRSEPGIPSEMSPTASRKESLINLANRRYTSVVDLKAILSLKDRAQSVESDVAVRYARDLRPNDFKAGNVILLGSSEADPWDELYAPNMNFTFKNDYKNVFTVRNRNPQKGEPSQWESKRDDPERRVFGVVAYMPSLAGDGNALLLEGTGMSGTEAGMDFILDDTQLLPFLNRIRRADGTLPHFELLLETHNVGASAIRSQILAWRAID